MQLVRTHNREEITMATTKAEITQWLHRGQEKKATHVLVVCDTFDWSDYPVFVMPGEDAREIAEKNNGRNMTKLMEVYKLADDWQTQLDQRRCFNY
jgi:hypothetical protein